MVEPRKGTAFPVKLQSCLYGLSQWSSKEFGNVKEIVSNLKERIQYLRSCPRSDEIKDKEAELSNELDEWLEREEIFWRQRSRAEWLRQGDRNTAYFHAKASQRRKRNRIDGLENDRGELCESEESIISIVTNYFNNIFESQGITQGRNWEREFENIPKVISVEMNQILTAPFSESKVKRALFQIHPTKALGVDGFTALFFQSNWDVVGNDVVKVVLDCLNNDSLDAKLNETMIVLVPKVKKWKG
ncbi:hypothetical protein QQ045_014583 [Rhodiola kirilowii]